MVKFYALNIDQISYFGKMRLNIFKKCTSSCFVTDFAILTGILFDKEEDYDNSITTKLFHKGPWWIDGRLSTLFAYITEQGSVDMIQSGFCGCGFRPVTNLSSLSNDSTSFHRNENDILEFEFGEYPQFVVSHDESILLEKLYCENKLNITGKRYTTNAKIDSINNYTDFSPLSNIEYEYNGKKYIRYKAIKNEGVMLSSGEHVKKDSYYWIKVQPLVWLVEKESNLAISKYILFSGMPLSTLRNFNGSFSNSSARMFFDKYFSIEFISNNIRSFKKEKKLEISNSDLDEWISWSNKNNIHPIIHMFMLNTEGKYLKEKIEWKEASNKLYKTNDLFSLKDYLSEKVFFEISSLYLSINISVDDVLNDRVNDNVINKLTNVNKYLLVVLLTLVDEVNCEYVSNFIKNKLGKKYSIFYDSLYKKCSIERKNKSLLKRVLSSVREG